jgi:hypothetical protein
MARIRRNGNIPKKSQSPRADPPPEQQPAGAEEQTADEPQGADGAAQLPPIFKAFADTTSHVVRQAASILEEEIAAGILAAKQIQNKFIDTSQVRSGKPDEVLPRFRRDAHDVVDIVIDIVAAAASNAARMAQRAVSIRGSERAAQEAQATSVLAMTQPVKPGETGEVSLVVENDGETSVEPFELRATDLINASGESIPAHSVHFEPKTISIAPRQNQRVVVRVTPPMATPPGTYSGLIQSSRPDQLRAVLTVTIA